jgi:hypothetical protein
MNRGRVGEERGGKEMDGCPLRVTIFDSLVGIFSFIFGPDDVLCGLNPSIFPASILEIYMSWM